MPIARCGTGMCCGVGTFWQSIPGFILYRPYYLNDDATLNIALPRYHRNYRASQ